MDNNLILPGGAIVVDNTLMKVCSQALAPPELADLSAALRVLDRLGLLLRAHLHPLLSPNMPSVYLPQCLTTNLRLV